MNNDPESGACLTQSRQEEVRTEYSLAPVPHQLIYLEVGGGKERQILLAHCSYSHWHTCQRIPHTILLI